jgi:ribonuclease HII
VVKVRAYRTLENALRRMGFVYVAGVDEVGRGCLAGPVVAAAVVLDPERYIPRICDSKTVTAAERERLYVRITREAICWSVVGVDPEEIDRINIHQAGLRAMQRAVMSCAPCPDMVLVDGGKAFRVPDLPMAQRCIVGGDARCTAIAAASIVAKVTRDRYMRRADAIYPHFGFASHVGYITPGHSAAVRRRGPSEIHRRSFQALCYLSEEEAQERIRARTAAAAAAG